MCLKQYRIKKSFVVFILLSASLFAAEQSAFTASTEVHQWDFFPLPLPGISMGPVSLKPDAGFYWNLIDVRNHEFDYEQISIRPLILLGAKMEINFGKNFGINPMSRYNFTGIDNERISGTQREKITFDGWTHYADLRLSY